MKLAIMQPYLFPYIGYFQLMNVVDKFVIYDDVNFIKKGWINRNNILVNNQACLFTVPLKDASQNKLINEVYLAEDQKWRENLLKTIRIAYTKAPRFDEVFLMLEEILKTKVEKISDLIFTSLEAINHFLEIATPLVRSSSIYNLSSLKGQERILGICKNEKTNTYINPIGGQNLYSKSLFLENNIELNFINTQPITYKQFGKEFIPWLSIIDVLMFNTKEETKTLLNLYTLL
jgi:hypothetical protein